MADSKNSDKTNVGGFDGVSTKAEVVPDPAAGGLENSSPHTPEQTTPKKRAAKDNDDAITPKKKRVSAKEDHEADKAEEAGELPVTPQSSRKRKAPGTPTTPGRPIPANRADADDADRMLVQMRDASVGWAEIRVAWTKATGENPGASTLPNRYNRLKANFMEFNEDDEKRLIGAKAEVEAKFAAEKWTRIAEAMEAQGAQKYPTLFIQKKVKELEKKGASNTAFDGGN